MPMYAKDEIHFAKEQEEVNDLIQFIKNRPDYDLHYDLHEKFEKVCSHLNGYISLLETYYKGRTRKDSDYDEIASLKERIRELEATKTRKRSK